MRTSLTFPPTSTGPSGKASAVSSPGIWFSVGAPTSATTWKPIRPSPTRKDKEATYTFSKDYRALFDDILAFARDYVSEDDGGKRRRRVRYWSALALLRCVSSSPAAAAATLRSRAAVDEAADEEVDEVGRRTVLDQDDADDVVTLDFSPGSDTENGAESTRRKLLEFARRAEALSADADHKLQGAIREVKALLKDGFHPVVFCRFVDTADYVARQLREALPAKVRVESVTGLLPPAEREARIAALVAEPGEYRAGLHRLPVGGHQPPAALQRGACITTWPGTRRATSSAKVAWTVSAKRSPRCASSPTTARTTRSTASSSMSSSVSTRASRATSASRSPCRAPASRSPRPYSRVRYFGNAPSPVQSQLTLDFIDDLERQEGKTIHAEWENARDREKASRSRFAQHTLSPEAVAAELQSVRAAIGRSEDVARFFHAVLQAADRPDPDQGQGRDRTPQQRGAARTSPGHRSRRTLHRSLRPAAGRWRGLSRPHQPRHRGPRKLDARSGT